MLVKVHLMINSLLMIDLLMHLLVIEMINYLEDSKILDLLTKKHIFQDGVDLILKMVYLMDSLQQVDLANLFIKN